MNNQKITNREKAEFADKTKMKSARRNFFIKAAGRMSKTKESMAKYALKNTTFYKRLYKKSDLTKGFKFNELPLVMKSEINKASPFDLLSDQLKDDVFKYGETTGSTGSPTPSFYTRKEFSGSVLLSKLTPFHPLINEVKKINRRAVCGLACGFTIAGPSFQQILDHYGFLTVNVDARTTIAPPARVARLLVRFKPSVIAAAETDFLAWMKIVQEQYPQHYFEVVSNLKVLLSTAELCSEERSNRIQENFNIIHIDNYACVEGYFSVPCLCGEKHILPVYHTEVFNDDLTECSEFGSGRFAFTNLIRKSTPFVRYLLDDYVKIYKSDCPYGFKKSIQPHGRYELTVLINGKRYGTRHFENLLFKHYLFGEYTVQIEEDRIDITVENYTESENVNTDKIEAEFLTAFGLPVHCAKLSYGSLRDYTKIRSSKPLFRLIDNRISSMQQIPEYV